MSLLNNTGDHFLETVSTYSASSKGEDPKAGVNLAPTTMERSSPTHRVLYCSGRVYPCLPSPPSRPKFTVLGKKHSHRWDILWLFLLTRAMLVLVTYFGYILLTQAKYSSAPVDISTLISSWNHWDARHYLNIALVGYHKLPDDLAFFPLFPLLIALLGHPFGDGSYFFIGMLLSNIALLGALFFLYTLAEELGGAQTGRRTVLYLCIFPTAFFFFTAYNEALFLFFTLGGFLALRRQRWWLAGLAGGLSALTRSTGVFFVVPFLYELWVYWQQIMTSQYSINKELMGEHGSAQGPLLPSQPPRPLRHPHMFPLPNHHNHRKAMWDPSVGVGEAGEAERGPCADPDSPSTPYLSGIDRKDADEASSSAPLRSPSPHPTHTIPLNSQYWAIAPLILVPLGTLLYCLYNWQITGNPMAFASVQSHWSRSLSLPWAGIWQNIEQVFWNQPFGSFNQVHSLIDLTTTLGFITLTTLGWRKSHMSYNLWLAFVFVYILVTPSTGQADGLISNQRFVLEMFPAFITLALQGQRYPRLHEAILWIFPALLGVFSLLFVLGKWMV